MRTAVSPDPSPTTRGKPARRSQPGTGRPSRVLVAGQVPPPICGQNLNIARMLRLLGANPSFQADHWSFRFTRDWSQVRQAGLNKGLELFRVWARLIRLRLKGRIDATLYPVGGPHIVPILRDLCLLPLALLCSGRVILHFRAGGLAESLPRFPSWLRWTVRKIYRRCGEAIVLTEYGKRDPEAAGIAPEDITVIPNACEDRYNSERKKRRRDGDPVILFNAGLLCSDKGTPELIEAFGRIARNRPELRLHLAGAPMGGFSEESMRSIAAGHGVVDQIEWCGVLRDDALEQAYANADLFVFPTVAPFESFGMVLIEAMMWGLPIVATDWRGNAEVMGSDPGGLLAPANESLADSLELALKDFLVQEKNWICWGNKNRNRFRREFEIRRLEERLASYLRTPDDF